VWGTDGRAVRDVIVAGEVVVHDRRCTKVDEDALQAVAAERGADLRRRAGITPTSKWPVSPA
jgi:5-methylthioadenosine/S-adenosylhomocysteine deaminase